MITLAEIQREAQESFADLNIPWETGRGVPSPTIRESLCESRDILEELYVKLYNGESVITVNKTAALTTAITSLMSSVGYVERETYCETIADELFQIYTLIEVYDRIHAIEELLANA